MGLRKLIGYCIGNCTAATCYSVSPKDKLVAAQQFSMNLPKGPKYPPRSLFAQPNRYQAPQFLAKQLTLSQPGGHIMPTTIL